MISQSSLGDFLTNNGKRVYIYVHKDYTFYTYLCGFFLVQIIIFHSLELANRNKEYLLQLLRRPYSTDYFVKEVTMDHLYTYEWSNGSDV